METPFQRKFWRSEHLTHMINQLFLLWQKKKPCKVASKSRFWQKLTLLSFYLLAQLMETHLIRILFFISLCNIFNQCIKCPLQLNVNSTNDTFIYMLSPPGSTIDRGRNSCDVCVWWWKLWHVSMVAVQRGVTGHGRTVYTVSWDNMSALHMTFSQGHSSCAQDT